MTRALYHTEVFLRGHLLNPFWHSRLQRRRHRGKVIASAVMRYLDDMIMPLPAASSMELTAKKEETDKQKIFSIWLQGEQSAPKIVQVCWKSIKANLRGNQELVILDAKSLFDWVDIPEHVVRKWKNGKMRAAHFTDIVRLALLARYGGVWMDATDYLPAPLPDEILEQDFFVYIGGDTIRGQYAFIQNCFICAKAGNPLICRWLDAVCAYWKKEDGAIDYFIHQLIFRKLIETDREAAALFQKMPKKVQDPTHQLWFTYGNATYNEKEWHRIVSEAIFQKTEYKSAMASDPKPGSFAEHLLKS
ncbi:MAG: hypothetical protein HUJ90_03615 [Bacteroidales bacterium]|nr:hypothetical protein [Bacteroidales bacterium]